MLTWNSGGIVTPSSPQTPTITVYYEGSDTLLPGYLLCANNDYGTAASATYDRFLRAEKPAAANIEYPLGFVSRKRSSYAGPCFVEIVPLSVGIAEMYTDASCTISSTLLFAQIGSYLIGNNGPVLVGQAMQTVDRSSTNGLVLARTFGEQIIRSDNQEANSSTTFTDAIWRNFPLALLRAQPHLGTFLEYDPAKAGQATFPRYASFASSGCTCDIATDPTLAESGQIRLIHDGTADDGIAVQFPGAIDIDGKPWAFEASVDLVSVTNTHQNALVGLGAAMTLTAIVPITALGALADVNFVGFQQAEAAGAVVNVVYRADGETAVAHDGTVKVPVANTAFKVAMYFDGTDINVYVDGTDTADPILASDIASATDIFPSDVAAYLTVGTVAAASVGASDGVNIRAFRVAQLA